MKIALAVFADFQRSLLGGPPVINEPLPGGSVFHHTLRRAAQIEGVDERRIVVSSRDEDAAQAALHESGLGHQFRVLVAGDSPRPRRSLIESARKWNIDAWRGSPLGTTWFDEFVDVRGAAHVLDACEAEAVLCIDGAQPLLEVGIAARMITRFRERGREARLVFTQAPPGLAGIVLGRDITRELLSSGGALGLLMSYRPETPRPDPITRPPCLALPPLITRTPARFTPDTIIGRRRIVEALEKFGADCTAEQVCREATAPQDLRAEQLPVESEIELTTADGLPQTRLRPRGDRVPTREWTDLKAITRVANELGALDDRLVVLGGFGDPLLHPQFPAVTRAIRNAGVFGLAVRTPLLDTPPAAIDAIFEARVDILEVLLDAHTPETYARLHNRDAYAEAIDRIGFIQSERQRRTSPQPIVVPSFTRVADNLAELDAFHDRWIRETGWAVVQGFSDHAGTLPRDTLIDSAPPVRTSCRRLDSRILLLADGNAVACDQDPWGELRLGNWLGQSLESIWAGPDRTSLREIHARLEFSESGLCSKCREWFRP